MNVREYISSGIVESYVLGLVTDAEREDFESRCQQYPEIVAARNAFELSLEQQLLKDAVMPSASVKGIVMDRISSTGPEVTIDEQEERTTPVRSLSTWKWLAAASLILLAGAAFWAFNAQQKLNKVEARNHELEQNLKTSNDQLARMNQDAEALKSPGLKMAALKGTPQAPQSLATVFWDTASASRDVYLMVNNLPQPATDRQYQLWAMLNGQPISLGVFDVDVKQTRLLLKMQNVQQAQAFAITLEPRGGSEKPTMEQMYVIGEL